MPLAQQVREAGEVEQRPRTVPRCLHRLGEPAGTRPQVVRGPHEIPLEKGEFDRLVLALHEEDTAELDAHR
ncbi:hypothetical protein ACFQ1I_03340 [Kitasatospora arboriphila]